MPSSRIRRLQSYARSHPMARGALPEPGHTLRFDGGWTVALTLNK